MAQTGNRIDNLVAALKRLSRREQVMVGGVAFAFVLFLGFFASMWISSTLGSLERRIEDKTRKLQTLIDDRQKFEQAKQLQTRSQQIMRRGKNIQLMTTIDELAKRMGVNVEDMQPRTATTDAEANVKEEKVEVNIKLISIDRLVDFLKEIEKKSQTIAVRKLRIKQSFQQPDQLEVGFTVSNFKLLEDKPEPPSPKGPPANSKPKPKAKPKPPPRPKQAK